MNLRAIFFDVGKYWKQGNAKNNKNT